MTTPRRINSLKIPIIIAGTGILAGGIFAWQSARFHIAIETLVRAKIKTSYTVQVGDVVHYTYHDGRCVPGIILDVVGENGLADIVIFDGHGSHPLKEDRQYIMSLIRNISPAEKKIAGTWHYQEFDRSEHVR